MQFKQHLMQWFAAAAIGASAFQAIAAPPRIEARDFFRDSEAESPTLSPTGEYMTIEVPKEDRTILVAMTTKELKPVGHFDLGPNNHIARAVWVNDNRIAIYLAKKLGSAERQVLMPNVLMSDVDGSNKQFVEMGAAYSIVDVTPDDPKTILVQRSAPDAMLYKMNVYSGNITKVTGVPLEPGSFVVDAKGEPVFAMGSKNDTKRYVYKRDGGSWKQVSVSEMGEGAMRPIKAKSDGKSVYLAISDKGEPARVVLRNLETGVDKLIFEPKAVDPGGSVSTFDRSDLAMVNYDDDIPYYEFVDPKSKEASVFGGLINSFDDKVVAFLGRSYDGNKILFAAYSDTDPGSYYLYDRETGKARFLLKPRPWIKPEQMATVQPMEFTARDGTILHGFLTIPNGSNGKNLPLVMHPHGGPHGPRDSWGFNPETQFLANRGYAVLQVNFRGSGGYGDSFERMGYRQWGTAMIDDMTDAVKSLIKDGVVDRNRMCTYGASYGGYASLQSVLREPDLYRCAVGYAGVYDLDQLAKDSDIRSRASGREYLRRVYPETVEERRAQSPIYNVDKLKAAVYLIHGGVDERTPSTQFNLLRSNLEKAGKPPEGVLVEPKEGHGFVLLENKLKVANILESFFARHMGPGTK